MIILAILVLMVSADGYRLDSQSMDNNPLKHMCEQNGVNYDNVEHSAIQFVNCIQFNVGISTLESELKQAESDDEYKKVFQKFCAKSPQIKTCYHKFLDAVMPCAGGEKHDVTTATKNVTDQVLDYVCFNGGEPITTFVLNRGPQCFSSKQFEIMMCAEHYKTTAIHMQRSMNLSTALNIQNGLLKCITEKLETCDNPTASSFFRNVSQIARNGFTQILESNANDMDTSPLPPPPVEYRPSVEYTENEKGYLAISTPPPVSRTSPMRDNMMKNMCEQNGVNYDNVENSAIQFVNCVQFNVGISALESELKQAESDDEYKKVFQKFCAKSPQIKTCYHKFLDAVMPCAGGEKHDVTTATKNVTDQILDYVCFNDGEPITTFVLNRGPQCFSSKQFEIMMCAEHYKTTAIHMQPSMNLSTALNIQDGFLKCITEKLETCDNPIASSFFRNVSQIARNGVSRILESIANDMDTTPLPSVEYTENEKVPTSDLTSDGYLDVSTPPPVSRTSPMSDNMMKNTCEQNGVNYDNIENSVSQFLKCSLMERDLKEVVNGIQYKRIFQKYCGQSSWLKGCYQTFFDFVFPCAGGEKYDFTKIITKKMTDQVLDYVCLNGGEPITNFMMNNGQQCFASKRYEIKLCAEYSKYVVMQLGPTMNLSVALNLGDKLLKCVAEKLETCDNPTASKFFANISRIIRGGISQVRESAAKYKYTTPRVKYLENVTQPGTATNSSEVTPPISANQLQVMCMQNGVDYQTVEAAALNLAEYLQKNFNFRLLMEVQDNITRSNLTKEYCAKTPELKTYSRAAMNAISPCFGVRGQNMTIISNNVNDQILDFVCYNDGSRITKFFTEGGPECLKSKSFELMLCMGDSATSSWFTNQDPTLSVTETFSKHEIVLNCIAQKLETCDRPTASEMLKRMIKIMHDTVQQGPVEVIIPPINRTEPEESLGSKFSKMCEANGENYWIITTIRDKAVSCLEDHLNMRISYQELMNAEFNGYFYTKFFHRYCSRKRDPHLKTCIRTFTYGVSPCFGDEAQHYLASTIKAYDQILDYVCKGAYEGFQNVSNFTARGFKCLENNAHEILRCAENHDVLDCTLKKLEACDSYKMFKAIGSIIRTNSLNQIKLISSYAEPRSKGHHFKTSGNLVLSFNADIVV